jgi:hypothetical protein
MKDLSKRGAWIGLLILVGVLSRWLPHPPNFSAFLAISLFAGYVLPMPAAIAVPIVSLFLGDVLIGFHDLMWVVYLSLIPVAFMGRWMPALSKQPKAWLTWGGLGLLASVFFFVTSNLAVWWASTQPAMGLGVYPHTWQGLVECYVMAIPFFHNSLLATWIYMGALEAVRRVRPAAFPVALRVN